MMQLCLRFEIIDSHSWNFKNLNATTRQQMALQGKIKKETSSDRSWTHCVGSTIHVKTLKPDTTRPDMEGQKTSSGVLR
jgi:hypothetical protein